MPLTAYEFGIIRKSITNRKADRLCRTAFSGISMPENHTPLSCFKIDGLKFAQKPTQKPQIFVVKIIIFSFRAFILFIHQKCKGKYRKSYLQCRSVQGNIPQPFRATILFSYFSGTI